MPRSTRPPGRLPLRSVLRACGRRAPSLMLATVLRLCLVAAAIPILWGLGIAWQILSAIPRYIALRGLVGGGNNFWP